jgi:hypothetical protein
MPLRLGLAFGNSQGLRRVIENVVGLDYCPIVRYSKDFIVSRRR